MLEHYYELLLCAVQRKRNANDAKHRCFFNAVPSLQWRKKCKNFGYSSYEQKKIIINICITNGVNAVSTETILHYIVCLFCVIKLSSLTTILHFIKSAVYDRNNVRKQRRIVRYWLLFLLLWLLKKNLVGVI